MKECPRCKGKTLQDEQVMNCLSKTEKIYICQACADKEDAELIRRAQNG